MKPNEIRCHNHIGFPHAGSCKLCELVRIRYEINESLQLDDWRNSHAITLTFKQSRPTNGTNRHEPITPAKASADVCHFFNMLNRKLLTRSECAKGYRIGTFATMEYGRDHSERMASAGRLHYHCMVECPHDDRVADLPKIVSNLWLLTRWGYDETCTKPCDAGWFDYIMKLRTKHDFIDSIDPYAWQLPKSS